MFTSTFLLIKRAAPKHTHVSRKGVLCFFLLNETIVLDSHVCDEWVCVGVRMMWLQVLWVFEDYIIWGDLKNPEN